MRRSRRAFLAELGLGGTAALLAGSPSVLRAAPPRGDDTGRIQQLLDQAAASAGTVALVAGPNAYGVSAPLTIPRGVSLVGEGPGTRIQAIRATPALLRIDAPFPGNRLGSIRELALDGNGMADVGLDLGLSVQRTLIGISVNGCRLSGIRLRGSQNNAIISCNFEENGTSATGDEGGGIELLDGAGNNAFVRVESNRNGGFQVVVAGGSGGAGTFPAGPSGNGFYNCVFERRQQTTLGCLRADSGRLNSFSRCDFSSEAGSIAVVRSHGALRPVLWQFDACVFSGAHAAILCAGDTAWGWHLRGCLLENLSDIAPDMPTGMLRIDASNHVSGVPGWAAQRGRFGSGLLLDASDWSSDPIVLGRYHLWIDPDGALRIHDAPPSSPLDGRRVGLAP